MLLYRTLTEFNRSFTEACNTPSRKARAVYAKEGEKHLTSANRLGPCWVRSETNHPCDRPAVVEIMGIPFCGRHAHEQEACFAVGQLAQAQGLVAGWQRQARDLGNEPLVEALELMQREFALCFAEARRRRGTARGGP
jgi:hypothetical protein